MGLEKNNSSTFLSIGDGKITKRVSQPTAESVQRTTKQGKIINEEIYDGVSGLILDIKTHDHKDYGKFWNVILQDDDDVFTLQMNYSGGYSSAFLKILPNIDLSQRVRISPSMKVEGTKKRVTLFISQNGTPLKHYYTKENPNGLPEMVQIKVKGKLQWDDSEMMAFLEDMVNKQILPKLKGDAAAQPEVPVPNKASKTKSKVAVTADVDEDEEKMPF